MVQNIKENMRRVVILDISGIYVQIHEQGYFDSLTISSIQQQYSNTKHWQVIVLD